MSSCTNLKLKIQLIKKQVLTENRKINFLTKVDFLSHILEYNIYLIIETNKIKTKIVLKNKKNNNRNFTKNRISSEAKKNNNKIKSKHRYFPKGIFPKDDFPRSQLFERQLPKFSFKVTLGLRRRPFAPARMD